MKGIPALCHVALGVDRFGLPSVNTACPGAVFFPQKVTEYVQPTRDGEIEQWRVTYRDNGGHENLESFEVSDVCRKQDCELSDS